jgi:phosphopantothenoylcysteine synthetase/decarboxylase
MIRVNEPARELRCLVTAGNTREPIDRVRDWGNIFTGNTGLAIAEALSDIARVDLLTSNAEHLRKLTGHRSIAATGFRTHAELRGLLETAMTTRRYDAVFMTAAVADYAPAGVFEIVAREPMPDGAERWTVRDVLAEKVRSHHDTIAVVGRRTEKLVDLFRTRWDFRGLLVKFKLEVGVSRERLIEIGQASRRASTADYLVANTLEMVSGVGGGAFLLSDDGAEWIGRGELASRLRALVQARSAARERR